jgi:GTPase
MRITDEIKVHLKAGNGGSGAMSFLREKFVDKGGPDGGNGGNGGSIIFVATTHLNTLVNFRFKMHFKAQNGNPGGGKNKTGKSAEDLFLEVPLGTQIFSEDESVLIHDLSKDGDTFEIASGGKGGAGNAVFKSSVNQRPREFTAGELGKEITVWLKLKILSDVGVIGLPNAGKSTFLSKISNAKPKIADYPFTTLSPNLGVAKVFDDEIVVADIPGLIEGAHYGHGLGDKFLKHIERCRVLIHLIDGCDEDVLADYQIIRNELEEYSEELSKKASVVCINKIDSIPEEILAEKIRSLEECTKAKVYCISAVANIGVDELMRVIYLTLKNSN